MPDLRLYVLQVLLLPDVLCYVFEILRSLFHRFAPALPTDSNEIATAPFFHGRHDISSSKCGSPNQATGNLIATAQGSPGRPPIDLTTDDCDKPVPHAPQSAAPQIALEHSTLTQTPDLATPPPATNSPPAINFNPSQHQDTLAITQNSQVPATAVQQPLPSRQMTPPARQYSPQPQYENPSMTYSIQNINDSRNVSVDGNMNTVTYTNTVIASVNNFMKELLEMTIPGAAFNSSARDPPPRCHPGTRLAILERCIAFIVSCVGERKMRWVVGAAGVGKSAIMQSVAESALPSVIYRASIFFFVNGRNDGSKAIVTLAYQLATKCTPYRQFVEYEITQDPSLLQSSITVQFNKFLVEPFIYHPQLNSAGRVLIIIDGLDECNESHTQQELLRLISDFCLTYPSSPIVWMIASRPEPHLTSFFAQAHLEAAYEKEEIPVDSNEARADVESFLHAELGKIQTEFSLDLREQWPSEQNFWKLAKASGGLFVYAHTVIKHIGNPNIGDPIEQLNDVLRIIDTHPLLNVTSEEHPMAFLDALYSQIWTKVPARVKANARKLLLALVMAWDHQFNPGGKNFIVLCNWLGMTCDEAYAAIRHLSSVLDIPARDEAHKKELRCFHKSFLDYVSDFSRSGFSRNVEHEARQLWDECLSRVLDQAPDGIDVGDLDYFVYAEFPVGTLMRGPGTGSDISLTWPVDEQSGWDNDRTRLCMYRMAVGSIADGLRRMQVQPTFFRPEPVFCIRLLAGRFQSFDKFSVPRLFERVFDESCRSECMEQSLLQQIPVKMLDSANMRWDTQLQVRRPETPTPNVSDLWDLSCTHQPTDMSMWEDGQVWSTEFGLRHETFYDTCDFCCRRLRRQLEMCKARSPDYPVSVLFTSTGVGFVEFKFIDLEDGVTEWTYYFGQIFSEEERKRLGSTV